MLLWLVAHNFQVFWQRLWTPCCHICGGEIPLQKLTMNAISNFCLDFPLHRWEKGDLRTRRAPQVLSPARREARVKDWANPSSSTFKQEIEMLTTLWKLEADTKRCQKSFSFQPEWCQRQLELCFCPHALPQKRSLLSWWKGEGLENRAHTWSNEN